MIQHEIYEFGPYVLDSAQMLLLRDGSVVPLQPRALETLLALVRRHGEVVTKQELMESVWSDSFVEEGNLTQNIFVLRRELGKAAEGEDYIQTVPKRGYRMNVPIVNLTAQEVSRNGVAGIAREDLNQDEAVDLDAASVGKAARWIGNRSWLVASVPVMAMLLIFVLVVVGIGFWRAESARPRVSGYAQITHDGAIKRGHANQLGGPDAALFTDGTRLYFMEGSTDAPMIAQVSASGGETGQVAVPFELPELLDVSRTRSELLVGGSVNSAAESPLWIVPVPAGSAHRLQDISAWDGSWSPDGREMVYVKGMDLYSAKSDGSDVKHLAALPGQGWEPRWSPDGQWLRLTVLDVKTSIHSLWELSRDGTGLRPLTLNWSSGNGPEGRIGDAPHDVCCGSWSPDGRDFVFQETRGSRSEIWSIPGKPSLLGRLIPSLDAPVQVSNGQLSSRAPVFSPDGSKLFVIGQQLRGELERFDRQTKQFVPYLGGISADFVDFSRDGKWVAYVAYPEGTLWRSRTDGSERLQLTVAPMEVTVPRWSPDGSQISFYVIGGAKQQRLYLIGADGGTPKAATSLDGGEMSAHWSPDGGSVLYSDFPFFSATPAKVAVHRLDLKTQKIDTLPGSEGYFAPTWSPDGRYATAMALGSQRIMLFDFTTNAWTELTIGAGLQKWSPDSQYLYYLRFGPESAVMRIQLSNRHVEEVSSLKAIRQAGRLAGLEFGLTPEGDPLVLRDVGTQEIYSLDWTRH